MLASSSSRRSKERRRLLVHLCAVALVLGACEATVGGDGLGIEPIPDLEASSSMAETDGTTQTTADTSTAVDDDEAVQAPTYPAVGGASHFLFDPDRGEAVLLGSVGPAGSVAEETWLFDLDSSTWRLVDNVIGQIPAPRIGAAAAYIRPMETFFVVGGARNSSAALGCVAGICRVGFLDETWLLHPEFGWEQVQPPQLPPPRIGGAMVYDPANAVAVLFGGTTEPSEGTGNKGTLLDDTWIFDPATQLWEQIETSAAPSPRTQHAMAYDPATGRVFLYGGRNYETTDPPHDLWSFDVATRQWTEIPLPEDGPGPRWFGALVYEPTLEGLLLVGGSRFENGTQIAPESVWLFDPASQTWSMVVAEAELSSAVFAPGDGTLVAFLHETTERYDLATGERTVLAQLPEE